MSREEETQEWEKRKKLIIFLYRRHRLVETIRLMRCSGFTRQKREYVYRLPGWGIYKNKAPQGAPTRPRSRFSDLEEEFYLCLSAGRAFESYWQQVTLMGDNEQDLGLLLCCARTTETDTQRQVLAGHIERRLGKTGGGDDKETRSFLRILRGYVLDHEGQLPPDVHRAVNDSVRFLDSCTGQTGDRSGDQRKGPYVIDMPKLTLFHYGMRICGVNQESLWKKLLDFHESRLSPPGNETACESTVQKCFDWCRAKLRSSPACDFSAEILGAPCCGADGRSAWKVIAFIFCSLLSQYVNEQHVPDCLSRGVNQLLRISVCDLLYTLSALIVAGPSSAPVLDFDHLCDSPAELMTFARQRAEALPRGQELLVFFLYGYVEFTLPRVPLFQDQQFTGDLCQRAKEWILGLEQEGNREFENESMLGEGAGEFVHADMFESEGDFMDVDRL